ncbi:D-tyrosyl-tRNA(Tyr) deacylase [Corynebacterium rouxii]|uniref:D-tyrosyl-tRNA(Tyr) deacylase n=1 Tax=Corynebacterium rouxii TaxID=2719119 RepID=A0A6I8MCN8_9CORY|nr:D-tyrosyl-tRNA(Tyr) deacylase [Corynebacterium rouxii]
MTRVLSASVTVDNVVVGERNCPSAGGILALVGVDRDDSAAAWETMTRKIAVLRILKAEETITKITNGLRSREISVYEGRFGADMQVESVNDGPFTVIVECP